MKDDRLVLAALKKKDFLLSQANFYSCMNKDLPETIESPFCFSATKAFRCGCVYLQLKLSTGHHGIAANNLLVHLILWRVTC